VQKNQSIVNFNGGVLPLWKWQHAPVESMYAKRGECVGYVSLARLYLLYLHYLVLLKAGVPGPRCRMAFEGASVGATPGRIQNQARCPLPTDVAGKASKA